MHPSRRIAATAVAVLSLLVAACGAGASPSPTAAPTPTTAPSEAAGGMQVMATGSFEDIDGMASGTAQLVAEADGSYALDLEDFAIDSAAHTNVLLVPSAIHMSDEVDVSKALDLGPLTGASGMQSYPIPQDMAASVMDGYHAVVLWDTEMTHAIAVATLQ
jgi:Electron transfer DM13